MKKQVFKMIISFVLGIVFILTVGHFADDRQKTLTLFERNQMDGYFVAYATEPNFDYRKHAPKPFEPMDIPLETDLQEFIYMLANEYDIYYPLLLGLIETESSFNTNIISNTDDYGLMQINEINHIWLKEQLKINDFLDPYENVRCGVYILNKLFDKYGDTEKVLMAYNMGEYGAKKFWNKGVLSSSYSRKVLANAQKYKELLE